MRSILPHDGAQGIRPLRRPTKAQSAKRVGATLGKARWRRSTRAAGTSCVSDIKKTRYACEFFEVPIGRTVGKQRARKFDRSLKDLQSGLGKLNDMAIHARLASELRPIQQSFTKGFSGRISWSARSPPHHDGSLAT